METRKGEDDEGIGFLNVDEGHAGSESPKGEPEVADDVEHPEEGVDADDEPR